MKELMLNQYRKLRESYYLSKRKKYFKELSKYFESDVSIICSNCLSGRLYQDLNLQYSSPTLGLYFMYPDFIEFLQDLEHNLKAPLTFVSHSKYRLGNERIATWKHKYPIGLLDNKIEIHFLHYYSEEEAAEKWSRRCSRVNMNNLVIIACEQNLATEKDVEAFDKLPFDKKIFFTSEEIKTSSSVFVKEFKSLGETGDPFKKTDLYYRELIRFIGGVK